MTDREHRLRARIDALMDERDRLEQRILDLETRLAFTQRSLRAVRRSRTFWRDKGLLHPPEQRAAWREKKRRHREAAA